ncbi:MAG: hypothetical protein NTY37_06210 [Methanothrix sp.]|nr:hypothetical protein [Methanothrix sp.]
MYHIRSLLPGDEVALRVFGQASLHLGRGLGEFVLGVELLQLRSQAGERVGLPLISGLQGLRA